MRRWAGFLAATVLVALAIGTEKGATGVRAGPAGATVTRAPIDAGSSSADETSHSDLTGCGAPLPGGLNRAGRGLPWPVVLATGCGRFVAFPSGLLTRAPADPGQTADPGYRVPAGPDSWAGVQNGHVVFVQRGREVWRSAGGAYDAQALGSAVRGRGWVAFSMYAAADPSLLYMSRGAAAERVVAHNEDPLVATAWGGFISSRWRSDGTNPDLIARGADGSLVSVVARHVSSVFPESGGTALYGIGMNLMRTDGMRSSFLADLSSVASPSYLGVEPLPDGRILVGGRSRVAVLRPNGRIESSASLAPVPKGGSGFLGAHTVTPWGQTLVVAATRWNDQGMGGGPGWEGVYALQPGASTARLLYGRRLNIAICAHQASFSWYERWLLYSACEGRVVSIDTTGRHAPIVLTHLARGVPEPEEERKYGLYGAEWAPFGPGFDARRAITLR